MEKIKITCELEVALLAIGGKWKALILYYLIDNGTKRFGEIMQFLNYNVSHKTLTAQLRDLENNDLITRNVYPVVPPKVEYTITKKGKSLFPILELMCEWGNDNLTDRYELIHSQCK